MASKPKHEPSTEQPQIPIFASREEEAAFWDAHDVADYQHAFVTVRAPSPKSSPKRVARHPA
jgi:hypothetical protein